MQKQRKNKNEQPVTTGTTPQPDDNLSPVSATELTSSAASEDTPSSVIPSEQGLPCDEESQPLNAAPSKKKRSTTKQTAQVSSSTTPTETTSSITTETTSSAASEDSLSSVIPSEHGLPCDEESQPINDAKSNDALVIENTYDGNPFGMQVAQEEKTEKGNNAQPVSKGRKVWNVTKRVLNYVFIDGLSGMAIGLFCTLLIGTMIAQIGSLIPGVVGKFIGYIGTFAKAMMGAGIGLGMAYKLKKAPMVSISAGVAGMIGAFASNIIKDNTAIVGVGEPLGAFVAAFVALEVGSLVSGKTKVDLIVTPFVGIMSGAVVGLLLGPPISAFMSFIGNVINASAQQQPVLMGILVAVLMGIALTLPISSAAIGVSLGLSGIAAGAAVMGCCCQMVGFAVMSFRENKWSGLVAQGLGTSMLQMPNIIRRPIVWLPPIIASAILGPISAVMGMTSTSVGAGMGTCGLVGNFQTYFAMTESGVSIWLTLIEIIGMQILLPAAICLGLSELMRHFKLLRKDDLKLDL